MLVRKMTVDDVAAVSEIEKACFSLPWSAKSFEDSITREDTIFLVCEVDAEETCDIEGMSDTEASKCSCIAGYIGMYLSFDEASVTNVAVSPEFRKKGCGAALVTAAKEAAKGAGTEMIFLEVRVSNEPAISLYRRNGFEDLGIRKNFYEHPVEDAIIMKVGI